MLLGTKLNQIGGSKVGLGKEKYKGRECQRPRRGGIRRGGETDGGGGLERTLGVTVWSLFNQINEKV